MLDDSLHKALYGRGKALYQSTHHYKDFGLLAGDVQLRAEGEVAIALTFDDCRKLLGHRVILSFIVMRLRKATSIEPLSNNFLTERLGENRELEKDLVLICHVAV